MGVSGWVFSPSLFRDKMRFQKKKKRYDVNKLAMPFNVRARPYVFMPAVKIENDYTYAYAF